VGVPTSQEPNRNELAQAKAALRTRIRAQRAARSTQERTAAARAFTDHVLALPMVGSADRIALTLAGPSEPPTEGILLALRERGVTVLAPQVQQEGSMHWLAIDESMTWQANQYGIREPVGAGGPLDADVILVPALAVTADGRRLGQGGGYFDRALALTQRPITTIAVVFDDEVVDDLPCEPHDARVDWVVTERRVLDCR
jgi:5-formyltetrahydrofolate cyclo-ligase